MTKEKAIEELENGEFWDKCVIPCAADNSAAARFHDALDVAIAVLQTQQEPNDPLTPEELREMDGEPVWIVRHEYVSRWALIARSTETHLHTYGFGVLEIEECGKTWWAYRRKSEEGTL